MHSYQNTGPHQPFDDSLLLFLEKRRLVVVYKRHRESKKPNAVQKGADFVYKNRCLSIVSASGGGCPFLGLPSLLFREGETLSPLGIYWPSLLAPKSKQSSDSSIEKRGRKRLMAGAVLYCKKSGRKRQGGAALHSWPPLLRTDDTLLCLLFKERQEVRRGLEEGARGKGSEAEQPPCRSFPLVREQTNTPAIRRFLSFFSIDEQASRSLEEILFLPREDTLLCLLFREGEEGSWKSGGGRRGRRSSEVEQPPPAVCLHSYQNTGPHEALDAFPSCPQQRHC